MLKIKKQIFIIHTGLIYRLFGKVHQEERTCQARLGNVVDGKTHLILSDVPIKSPIGFKLDT